MKKNRLSLFLIIVILFSALSACSNTDENSISILFVGNSYVYAGNLPDQIQTVSGLYEVKVTYRDISKGGATLSDSKDTAVREMKRRNYDYVVIQDQSRRPIQDTANFNADVQFLCETAVENGTVPVLYSPAWADIYSQSSEQSTAKAIEQTTEAYRQAAAENDAILINTADAWAHAYETVPGISLFGSDGVHANDAGAYYTACVFAATLFDLHIQDIAEDSLYTGSDMLDLGQAAWAFVHTVD